MAVGERELPATFTGIAVCVRQFKHNERIGLINQTLMAKAWFSRTVYCIYLYEPCFKKVFVMLGGSMLLNANNIERTNNRSCG